MSVKVMSWVWDYSASRGNDRLVLLAIADHAGDNGDDAWPSIATLARKTGLHARTVQRCIADLVELGELKVTPPGVKGTKANKYKVRMQQRRQTAPLAKRHPRQSVTPGSTPPLADSHDPPADRQGPPGSVPPTPRQRATQTVLEPSVNRPEPSTGAQAHPSARATTTDVNKLFDQFWAVYPRHEGKAPAKLKFNRALKKVSFETIMAGAQRYRDDPNREDAYTAHGATWLNQERWSDPPLPSRTQQRAAAAAAPEHTPWRN